MQKFPSVFDPEQQSRFQQLQLEVTALEEQVENALKEQLQLAASHNSQVAIPLIYVNEQVAKSGIRLVTDITQNNEKYIVSVSYPKGYT